MLLADLAATSAAVALTRSRTEKRRLLAELLRRTPAEEVEVVATYLSGTLRQRRTGVGWRGVRDLPDPAPVATLSVIEVDRALEELAALAGPGSATERRRQLSDLFGALTAEEQGFLRSLITGAVRQGALDSVMLDAIAAAADLAPDLVRQASMFSAPTGPVAAAALAGGEEALRGFSLQVGRPIRPMLASSAPDVGQALDSFDGPAVLDSKLDGIRIQVHKRGEEVTVFTRSLEEIGDRLPEVVTAIRTLPASSLILDGEALLVDASGAPRPFQETAAGAASTSGGGARPFFFDLLAIDEESLIDAPAYQRWDRLDALVPGSMRTERLQSNDQEEATGFFARVIEAGHEGVIVKDPGAPYAAGRRGAAWVKVKPRHTLDLVVLAVEWGSGRRAGKLSNIHLGARSGDGFTMLGKTFKGMTDEILDWQTARFEELKISDDGWVVTVRPEQVVEIAFDGVQRSTRYPGGVALRFARVLRYRDDKSAAEADTLESVREFLA